MATETLETPADPHVRRIPFSRLPAFSRLYQDYVSDYPALSEYFAGDFRDPEVLREAADRAAGHARDRRTLVQVLLEQNARWGLDDATRGNIGALEDPETVAVVTGQQVGLFTGPAYTVYKTLTTLQLARRLAEDTGRRVVPVFWVEGEDHDFDEIAHVALLHRNKVVDVRYAGYQPPVDGHPGAVGRLALTEQIAEVLSEVDEALAPTDFKPAVMEMVREAYQPGISIEDAFTGLMKALFPESGLVYLNPDDARLKQLAAPLFRGEIENPHAVAAAVGEVSEQLEQNYHAQVRVTPTDLFLLTDEGRYALDAVQENEFALHGNNKTYGRRDLLELLEREPERFSPNVVLRPLMQDLLVPTAVYVAGPSETAYFAQFRPVYEWAGVPMPVIYPRASITLMESKVEKVLDRYGLAVPDFGEDIDALFQRVVLQEAELDVDDLFGEASSHLHRAVNEVKAAVEQVDRTLVKSAEATRAALMKEMDQLKHRVIRAEKRSHEQIRKQLEKAHVNLFPDRVQQERKISILYALNKYSPALLGALMEHVSLDTTEHQVVTL